MWSVRQLSLHLHYILAIWGSFLSWLSLPQAPSSSVELSSLSSPPPHSHQMAVDLSSPLYLPSFCIAFCLRSVLMV